MSDESWVPPGSPQSQEPTRPSPSDSTRQAAPSGSWAAPGGGWAPPGAGPAGPLGPTGPGRLHKPGTLALRPQGLSDVFDATFGTIRRNPGGTVGIALLLGLAFMLIPLAGAVLVGTSTTPGVMSGEVASTSGTLAEDVPFTDGDVGYALTLLLTFLFTGFTAVFTRGIVTAVTARSALGEQVGIGRAWRLGVPHFGRLFLLGVVGVLVTLLIYGAGGLLIWAVVAAGAPGWAIALVAVPVVLVAFLAAQYVNVRYLALAAAVVVLEKRRVLAAIARAGRLTGSALRSPFWRILGTLLLFVIIGTLAAQLVGMPLGFLAGIVGAAVQGPAGVIILLVATQISSVLGGALDVPLRGIAQTVLYLDQRIRREGFDLELIGYVQARSDQAPHRSGPLGAR